MKTVPWILPVVFLGMTVPVALRAHTTPSSAREVEWWRMWDLDPLILFNLIALGWLYAVGMARLGRRQGDKTRIRPRHGMAFAAGLVFLAVALLSPVSALAGELQWVHMVQHMVLMNLAAPLFVLGSPGRVMIRALPANGQRRIGRGLQTLARLGVPRYLFWQPVTLWVLYALVLWVWHLPVLYEAALHDDMVHDLQHLMFFAVSALFWRVLFDPIGRLRLPHATAVLYLFLTSLHATVLGVFMALAPRLWYAFYAGRAEIWGFGALEDQQLAGYIMWMPACMIYAVIAAVVFSAWLAKENDPPASAVHGQDGHPHSHPLL